MKNHHTSRSKKLGGMSGQLPQRGSDSLSAHVHILALEEEWDCTNSPTSAQRKQQAGTLEGKKAGKAAVVYKRHPPEFTSRQPETIQVTLGLLSTSEASELLPYSTRASWVAQW